MEDSKKISELLDRREKAEDEVRRIHKLVFEVVKSDDIEMRILWREYEKAKKQLVDINEEIGELRRKCEAKATETNGTTQKPTVEETATEKEKTESRGTQEIIRLVGNTGTSVNKKVKSQAKLVQPSAKSEGNKVVKPKDEEEDKRTEDKNEGKKSEEDIKIQAELDKNSEKKKTKRIQETVRLRGISIRVPQEIEPKPIIPSERLR